MSDEQVEPPQELAQDPPQEPTQESPPEPPQEPTQEPPQEKRGRGRPRKDPNAPPKPRAPRRKPVERQVSFEEEPIFEEEMEEIEEDAVHTLARMIMQHEREQRANAMSKYDRLLGFA